MKLAFTRYIDFETYALIKTGINTNVYNLYRDLLVIEMQKVLNAFPYLSYNWNDIPPLKFEEYPELDKVKLILEIEV